MVQRKGGGAKTNKNNATRRGAPVVTVDESVQRIL